MFQFRTAASRLAAVLSLLLLFSGCGSDDNFVFTNSNPIVNPPTADNFSLTVGFDQTALSRDSGVRAQLIDEVTQFQAILIDSDENQAAEQTAPRDQTVTFTGLSPGDYLVRVLGLDANGNVLGYFDRIVTVGSNDLTTLLSGLRLDPTPPAPSFAATQTAGPFLVFISVPETAQGITGFSVVAQVFDGQGNPTNSVTPDISLASSPLAFETPVADQDSGANGVVTFTSVRFEETADGTTVLTVDAAGVEPANSPEVAVTPPGPFFNSLELISQSTAGDLSNDTSFDSSVSGDGRYVVFSSNASNLVPNDDNDERDVFLRDRSLGTTVAVSINSSGEVGNESSSEPSISADGRFIAFTSGASDLVPDDDNDADDIFVYDRVQGTMERVSIDTDGTQGDGDSFAPALSDDGQVVVFMDQSENFDEGSGNDRTDVFIYDRSTGTLEIANVPAGIGLEFDPAISGDGRYVSYVSPNPEGLTDTNGGIEDVFVFDRTTDTRVIGSTDAMGDQGGSTSRGGSLSSDGRFLAFHSRNNYGFTPDNNGANFDVFVKDLQSADVERISENEMGENGDAESLGAFISGDGRFVVFLSEASDLVPNDTNSAFDVFLNDRENDRIERISVSSTGQQIMSGSTLYGLSADGRFSIFRNSEDDLVPNKDNGEADIYSIINPFRR